MAENDGEERTEEPSDQRKSQMRDEGQIPRSQEIGGFVAILGGFAGLAWFGGRLFHEFRRCFGAALSFSGQGDLTNVVPWIQQYVIPVLWAMLAIIAVLYVSSFVASAAQTGLHPAWKKLKIHTEPLNPFKGLKRMVSPATLIMFIKNMLKVIVIGWIVYSELIGKTKELVWLASTPLPQTFAWCIALLAHLVGRILIFLGIVAAADYLYQWWTVRKTSLMSKYELKEETRSREASPHVRQKIRAIANQIAKKGIKKEVPTADVIVTNPTHYAVALRYDRANDRAPRVVAKGKDLIAAYIRQVATEHNIPLYEFPELARSLYAKTKLGQFIPSDQFEAVARVLAYIYQSRRRPRRYEGLFH